MAAARPLRTTVPRHPCLQDIQSRHQSRHQITLELHTFRTASGEACAVWAVHLCAGAHSTSSAALRV